MGRRVRAFRVHRSRYKHRSLTDSERYNDAVGMLIFGMASTAIALLFAAAIVFPGTFIAVPALWLATTMAIPASSLGSFLGLFASLFGLMGLCFGTVGAHDLYELKEKDQKKVGEKKLDKEEQIEPKREQPEHTEKDEMVTKKPPIENEHEASSKKPDQKKQIENKYEQTEEHALSQKNHQLAINDEKKSIPKKINQMEQIENKGKQTEQNKKTEVHLVNSKKKKQQLAISNEIHITLEAKSKSEGLKSGSEKKVAPLEKVNTIRAQQKHIGQNKNKTDKPTDFTS